MEKIRVKMTKPLYLGMSIFDISKILMHKFWYEQINPKYGDRAKLCNTDTDSLIIYIKTNNFLEDNSNDIERLFDSCNYDKNNKRPLPIGKNKKYLVFLNMNQEEKNNRSCCTQTKNICIFNG